MSSAFCSTTLGVVPAVIDFGCEVSGVIDLGLVGVSSVPIELGIFRCTGLGSILDISLRVEPLPLRGGRWASSAARASISGAYI